MITLKKTLTFILLILTFNAFSQTYDTYDDAYESFLRYGKQKAFDALESKYEDCKHIESSSLNDVNESANSLTGRMDIEATWDFKYKGCYWGFHKYKGTSGAKGYITQNSDGKFKYGFRGTFIVRYDPDK